MTDRIETLRGMHEAEPDDPFTAYALALEHVKAGQFEQALHWLDQTVRIDPHYCYAYYHKAKLLSDHGDDARARAVLETGIAVAAEAGDEHARSEMMQLAEGLGGG